MLVTWGAKGIGAAIAAKALAEGGLVSFIDLDDAAGRELLTALDADKRVSVTVGDLRRPSDIEGARGGPEKIRAGRRPRQQCRTERLRRSRDDERTGMGGRVRRRSQIGLARGARSPARDEGGEKGRDRQHRLAARGHDLSGNVPLCSGEMGVIGLTRPLELGPWRMRVNTLSPGYVETALVTEFFDRN